MDKFNISPPLPDNQKKSRMFLSNFWLSVNKVSKFSFLVIFSAWIYPVWGIQVNTTIEPAKILIGEHAVITYTMEVSENAQPGFPAFGDTITSQIEIISYSQPEFFAGNVQGMTKVEIKLTVTSWQEGFHPVVPFVFYAVQDNDTIFAESQPVLLEVAGVQLDETARLKDIKGILPIPLALTEVILWLIPVVIVVVVIFQLHRFLKNRKKQPQQVFEKPEIPPHIAALASLENLNSKKLWQNGLVKDYYVELTDILRLYIEKRFGIPAIEMTTAEIMAAIGLKADNYELSSNLNYVLQIADMVKFAKYIPVENENELSMDLSFRFVKCSIPDNNSVEDKLPKQPN